MPQSLSNLVTHLVFSTKHRMPTISTPIEKQLYAYMTGIFKQYDSPSILINGTEDHVHALFVLSKNHALASVVKEVKRGSSIWMKTHHKKFYWQDGYAAFSVSESQLEKTKTYIRNQKQHHKKMTFQDELRVLFKKHRVEYDERYVWD